MTPARASVMFVVAATLVAVTTIVLGMFGAVDFLSRRRDERARLERVASAQTEELAAALALPVWNIDRAQIDKILDSQIGAMAVEAVIVQAAGGVHARRRTASGRFVSFSGDMPDAGLLVRDHPITFNGEQIGTVRLYATPRIIEQQLRRSLITSVAAILAVDAILVLSIYWVLWRSVLRPLVAVEKFAARVSEGTASETPSVPRAATAELERLRTSIETMVQLLDKREQAVKDEKDFTETALDVMRELFFVQNRAGRFVRWNQQCENLFPADLLGRSDRYIFHNLLHPDDRPIVQRAQDDIFELGVPREVEVRYKLADGTHHLRLGGRRMDIGGEPYLVATGVDVTEQLAADAERLRLRYLIEQAAIEWRQTFDSVQTPIVIADPDGTIRRLNDSAAMLAGPDLAGRKIRDVQRAPWDAAAELIAGESAGAHAETRDADGRYWDIGITRLFPDSDDHSLIVVFWDITRVVALQESLRRSETMTAMGKLVGGVAHEVRNPLFGISATIDAYSEELNTPDLQEMAATLRDQVGRLTRLMRELLEFGKPVAVSRRPGSLAPLVDEVVASRRVPADEARVQIRNGIGVALPRVPMDRERLRQVFENLVDNALQHSPPGSAITISGEELQQGGRPWLEFRVEDEGKGFAPGELAQVFEPFFTRRDGGTGLGLSIVQKIVEEHEGCVTAANREGGGATVTVRLPAV